MVNCVLMRDYSHGRDNDTIPIQKLNLYYAKRPSEKGYSAISDASVKVSGSGKVYEFIWNGDCWVSAFLPEFEEKYNLTIQLRDGKKLSSHVTFPEEVDFLFARKTHLDNDNIHSYSNPSYTIIPTSAFVFTGFTGAENPHNGINDRDNKVSNLWIMAKEGDKYVRKLITNHPNADNFNIIKGDFEDFGCYKYVDGITITNDLTFYKYLKKQLLEQPVHQDYIRIQYPWNSECCIAADFDYEREVPYDDPYGIDANGDGYYPGLYIDTRYDLYILSDEYDTFVRGLANRKLHADELFNQYYSPDMDYTNIENGIGCFGAMYHYRLIGEKPKLYIPSI